MALQLGTVDNVKCVVDSGDTSTPVTDVTGDGGDIVAGAAALLANTGIGVLGAIGGRAAGTLLSNVTPVGNVGSGDDDLMSYTIPANTLATDGDAIRFESVVSGDNEALVHVGVLVAGSQVGSADFNTGDGMGLFTQTLTRLTSSTLLVAQKVAHPDGQSCSGMVLTGVDFAAGIVLKLTGTSQAGGGVMDNDVKQLSMLAVFYPTN